MIGRAEAHRVNLRWHKSYRIVSAKHPPINIFESIVGARQMDMAFYLEGLTNDRLRDESREAPIVDPKERVTGAGASIVMAAFTHIGRPSRFSDGSYGVYYAAHTLETAVRETAYHRARFLAATNEPPCDIDMRAYVGKPTKPFLDVRASKFDALHDPDDYGPPQVFAKPYHESGEWGLVYRSVRHESGECIAAFRPQAVSIPQPGAALAYVWDGERIVKVYEKSEVLFDLTR